MLNKKLLLILDGLFIIFCLLAGAYLLSSLQSYAARAVAEQGVGALRNEIVGVFLLCVVIFALILHYTLGKILAPIAQLEEASRQIVTEENFVLDNREQATCPATVYALNTLKGQVQELHNDKVREQRKLKLILDNMDNSVFIIDEGGFIVEYNRQAQNIFALQEQAEFLEQAEVLPNSTLNLFYRRILNENKTADTTLKMETALGKKTFQVFGAPLTVAFRPDPSRVLLVLHDITILQAVYEKQAEFVSNASHELATPLTTIKGFAETLLEDDTGRDDAARQKFLQIILDEGNRMQALLKDLLQLARLDSAQYRASIGVEMVAVAPLLAQLQLEFSQAAAQRDINLQIEQPETGLSVQANQTWVKQILVNLIENALKYTPLGGSIQISCLTVADEVQFTVYNTGEGISPLDAQRIFDRFYRIDKARSRKVGGTGLGLSIVKFVVEMFGGRIYAHSIKGQGVSFVFTLPASSSANKTLDGFVE